ncbi:MAG: DUF6057 family protein [Prevotella sp.]|nr:DUF6057 family protein [Prevotella sp.]
MEALRKWNSFRAITTILFGIAVFLFWLLAYPEALNYQEQNQLWLTTGDYFRERMAVPGGLADYVSEFLVQFYYVSWLGALLIAVVYAMMQWLMWMTARRWDKTAFPLTFLLPLLMLWHHGDIDTLMSLPVAIVMTLGATIAIGKTGGYSYIADLVAVPMIYWAAGPAAIIYVAIRGLQCGWLLLIEDVALLATSIMAAYWALDYQWPLGMMVTGINYYRIPLMAPVMQYVVLIAPVAIALAARFNPWKNEGSFKSLRSRLRWAMKAASLAIVAYFAISRGFDPFIYEILWQDSMVRQERWNDIIKRAENRQYDIAMSSNCVNLALGMTGQLADRMFTFKQSGTDALLLHMMRDNMSDLPTAEAFWRLGMVNSAKRYMMDIQQSILNARQSGRCTMRIAECHIVNGDFKAAEKRLNILKNTIFYRSWAEDAETYLYNDAKVNSHETWGKLRRYRFKDSLLYSYPEKHKMLGLLFQQNTDNRLALDYFMGQLLLDGEFNSFMGYMQWVQQYGGYSQMPYGYADAYQAIQQKGDVPGSAYASYVNKMMKIHNQ